MPVVLQLESSLGEMLKQLVLTKRLVSPECVRLFLVLPAFILQPLNSSLYAVFAAAVTALPAEWRNLLGESGLSSSHILQPGSAGFCPE